VEIRRFDVYLINLDPAVGTEIQKTRPCVVISPDEMNRHIATVIVAPMTTKAHPYPSRVFCRIALDQIRTVDRVRLVKRLGRLHKSCQDAILSVLSEMFAE
jgi:mRNA interferase MazF